MDYRELKKIVRRGEGQHIEFKLRANHPEKIVREAIAFANSEGGLLLIGINDDKEIRGLKDANEDEFALVRALEKHCHPVLEYSMDRVSLGTDSDREVLIFSIPSSEHVHYYIENPNIRKGQAYIRIDDKSLKASPEMKQILKGKKRDKNIKFTFGEKERILMQYLENNQSITVDEFSRTAKIPRKVASRTLVLLVLAKVLQIKPNLMRDFFEFREPQASSLY